MLRRIKNYCRSEGFIKGAFYFGAVTLPAVFSAGASFINDEKCNNDE